jgi:hypothetical protein
MEELINIVTKAIAQTGSADKRAEKIIRGNKSLVKQKRNTKKELKQRAIYKSYCDYLKMLGKDVAPYEMKKDLYSWIAEQFFVEADYVRKVVNKASKTAISQ